MAKHIHIYARYDADRLHCHFSSEGNSGSHISVPCTIELLERLTGYDNKGWKLVRSYAQRPYFVWYFRKERNG